LVEQQKPLEGGSWTTSALYLQGISLVRRNNEWHHFDPLGTAQVITNSSAQVVSNAVISLNACTADTELSNHSPWRLGWGTVGLAEEGLVYDSHEQTYQKPCTGGGVTPCGYIFSGLECHQTGWDLPLPGTDHFGPWSGWARIVKTDNPFIKAGWWCRSRIHSRVVSRRQICREIWKKNCPPFDTRYGPWRPRLCDVQQTRTEIQCCPQEDDPNTRGCGVAIVTIPPTAWSDSATIGCKWGR